MKAWNENCGTRVNRGEREKQNGGSQKTKKNEMSEEASAKREEILKSNERETSGAHQSDVDGNKKKILDGGRATCGPSSRIKRKNEVNEHET